LEVHLFDAHVAHQIGILAAKKQIKKSTDEKGTNGLK